MPMAKITPAGEHGLYHVHFLDGRTDPGFGHGGGEHPGNELPGSGGHPGNRPPGSASGGHPDNSLPPGPPPVLAPGYTLVAVRGPHGHWEYAMIMPGSPPPRPIPPSNIEHPGNRPPGSGAPDRPGNELPQPQPPQVGGGPAPTPPNRPDNTLPPTAQPRR